MSRPIHFVGSLGGAKNVSSAMELILSQRDHLFWLPDGEPAERSEYVRPVIEGLAARPGILVERHPRRRADWTSLRRRTTWKPARGHVLGPDDLRLGYAATAIASWPVFLEQCAAWDRPDLMFQVGLPSALSLAAVGFGLDRCRKFYPVVRQALTREIEDVLAQTRLFAGVVQCDHGARSSAEERTALRLFEGAAQRATGRSPGTVGVSCACGTGRTEEWKMARIFDRQLDLALNT